MPRCALEMRIVFKKSTMKSRPAETKSKIKSSKTKILIESIKTYWKIAKLKSDKNNALLSLKRFEKLHILNKMKRDQ